MGVWVYGCMGMGLTLADRHDSAPEPVVLAAASLASDEDVPIVTGVSGCAPRQPARDDHQPVVGTLQLLTEESWSHMRTEKMKLMYINVSVKQRIMNEGSHSQNGASPDHCPLAWHTRVTPPTSWKGVSQL